MDREKEKKNEKMQNDHHIYKMIIAINSECKWKSKRANDKCVECWMCEL